jgi:hypothetical protein
MSNDKLTEQQDARYTQLVYSARRIFFHWKANGANSDQALDLAEAAFADEAEYQKRKRRFLDRFR